MKGNVYEGQSKRSMAVNVAIPLPILLAVVFLLNACTHHLPLQSTAGEEKGDIDVASHFLYYGHTDPNPENSYRAMSAEDWDNLSDSGNNVILNECLNRTTVSELHKTSIPDLDSRIERLERSGLIKIENGKCALAFPTIIGHPQEELQEEAACIAEKLEPMARNMIAELQPLVSENPKMLYHMLWSGIMDFPVAWSTAESDMRANVTSGDLRTNNVAWFIYPSHPYHVGTVRCGTTGGNLLMVTTGCDPEVVKRVVQEYEADVIAAACQNGIVQNANAVDELSHLGLIEKTGKLRLFCVDLNGQAGQAMTKAGDNLGAQFGHDIMSQMNVDKISKMLNVPPGVAFVIAYHEICWELLGRLENSGALKIPSLADSKSTTDVDVTPYVSYVMLPKTQ